MDYFYHPLGEKGQKSTITIEQDFLIGQLKLKTTKGNSIFAMCSGPIIDCGVSNSQTFCILECNNNDFNQTFYIYYTNGKYSVSKGDNVSIGQEIGIVDDKENIIIEMCWNYKKKETTQIEGIIDETKTFFSVNGQNYPLVENLSFTKLNTWKEQTQKNNKLDSYCWITFAQNIIIKESSPTNATELTVTLDEYTAQVLAGIVAWECSWRDPATAQGILIVCRNWIYQDCLYYKKTSALSFTEKDIKDKNGLANHMSRFITGNPDYSQYSRWIELYKGSYASKIVSDTNLKTLDFVKKFMSEGAHWDYIDKALENSTAKLGAGASSKKDIEDCNGFPQNKYTTDNQRVVLLPSFGDWLVNWNYYHIIDCTKPSEILWK